MKTTTRFALTLTGLLAGCVSSPQAVVTKPGVSPAGVQAAVDSCKIASFKEIPQTMATDYRPGVHTPGSVQCNAIGTYVSCQNVGGVNIPASSTSYDVNSDLRDRYITNCLERRGFTVTFK